MKISVSSSQPLPGLSPWDTEEEDGLRGGLGGVSAEPGAASRGDDPGAGARSLPGLLAAESGGTQPLAAAVEFRALNAIHVKREMKRNLLQFLRSPNKREKSIFFCHQLMSAALRAVGGCHAVTRAAGPWGVGSVSVGEGSVACAVPREPGERPAPQPSPARGAGRGGGAGPTASRGPVPAVGTWSSTGLSGLQRPCRLCKRSSRLLPKAQEMQVGNRPAPSALIS